MFGHPETDVIAIRIQCVPKSLQASIDKPMSLEPVIALASGAYAETFSSRIVSGGEEWVDTIATTQPVELSQQLRLNLRRTGELKAAGQDRDFTAPTAEEREEIEAFFAACDRQPIC